MPAAITNITSVIYNILSKPVSEEMWNSFKGSASCVFLSKPLQNKQNPVGKW